MYYSNGKCNLKLRSFFCTAVNSQRKKRKNWTEVTKKNVKYFYKILVSVGQQQSIRTKRLRGLKICCRHRDFKVEQQVRHNKGRIGASLLMSKSRTRPKSCFSKRCSLSVSLLDGVSSRIIEMNSRENAFGILPVMGWRGTVII